MRRSLLRRPVRLRFALVLFVAALGGTWLAAQSTSGGDDDLSGFTVELADGVAPVESAPVTLTIKRIGPGGEPDPAFDWTQGGLRLAGLETVDGDPVTTVTVATGPGSGARKTEMRIADGALVITLAVIVDPVTVEFEGRAHDGTGRSVWGLAAIVPPLLAILLAILTRQVLFSLFAGSWLGAAFIFGGPLDGLHGLTTGILPDSMDGDRTRIVMFSCLLGAVVAMVARMGGTKGIVDAVSRIGSSRMTAQLTTWISGMLVFFDDYANALLVGNTMRPISDKFRVSREKLAYLVDSTSAPVACVIVISTWIVAEVGYIDGKLESEVIQKATGLEAGAGYQTFLETIPYNFYPILALVFGLTICLTRRDYGPMWRAEKRAIETGQVLAPDAVPLSSREMDELEPADPQRLRWYNAALPILSVVFGVLLGLYFSGRSSLEEEAGALRDKAARLEWQVANGSAAPAEKLELAGRISVAKSEADALEAAPLKDVFGNADSYQALMFAAFLGVLIAVILALAQRLMTLTQTMETVVAGIKSMIPAILVLILAWTLQGVCEKLNTSQWLIHHVDFTLELLPAVIFLLAALVGFSTGTSWGTMGILVPLTMEYAVGLAAGEGLDPTATREIMIASIGGVLAGAVFGDHCSPISDTTIMSSMACGSDHIDHVKTQMPYALTVAGIACLAGYIPAGFGFSPWVLLLVGAVAVVLVVRFAGKPAPAPPAENP